jgi:hypothetical protein
MYTKRILPAHVYITQKIDMKLPSGTEFNAIDIAIGAIRQPTRDSLPIAY